MQALKIWGRVPLGFGILTAVIFPPRLFEHLTQKLYLKAAVSVSDDSTADSVFFSVENARVIDHWLECEYLLLTYEFVDLSRT